MTRSKKVTLGSFEIEAEPWGVDGRTLASSWAALARQREVKEAIGGALLADLRPVQPSPRSPKAAPTDRYVASLYDHAAQHAIAIEAKVGEKTPTRITRSAAQPRAGRQEFDAAVEILTQSQEHGAALAEGRLLPYRPMPPFFTRTLLDGRVDRLIAVGLFSPEGAPRHRVVGVHVGTRTIVSRPNGAARDTDRSCGAPGSDACPASGAGQLALRVLYRGEVVWRFLVLAPGASSGTNGSGIELRQVDYRGRRVLYQAHAPILNVEYLGPTEELEGCGPAYRDWLNEAGCFEAEGKDIAPGFRVCPSPPQTTLEKGSVGGNFSGVAIHVDGQEVVLVSELVAGWYRYKSEWRLHVDGTIRPRFGFSAQNNPCTCKAHHHHVYWRLDFDLGGPARNVVDEYNWPPIVDSSSLHRIEYETMRLRDPTRGRCWLLRNAAGGPAYWVRPGANDGASDEFGGGDVWILRYTPEEIDDGQGFTQFRELARARIGDFCDGEPVNGSDVVLWYAGHFLHDRAHVGGHLVGPDLVPLCAAEYLARNTRLEPALPTVRVFRDVAMMGTARGRAYREALERHAAELVTLMEADGELRAEMLAIYGVVIDVLESGLGPEPRRISPDVIERVSRVFDRLGARGSKALRRTLQSLARDLRSFGGATPLEGLARPARS